MYTRCVRNSTASIAHRQALCMFIFCALYAVLQCRRMHATPLRLDINAPVLTSRPGITIAPNRTLRPGIKKQT